MRYLILPLLLMLSLNGCDEKQQTEETQAKHDAQIAKKIRSEVLAEVEAKRVQEAVLPKQKDDLKNAPLKQIGIHMEKDSITIDTNKTKAFLNDLSKKLEGQIKKISDNLEKGIVASKEAGININKEYINIDLNKTQTMFEDWGKKMQVFVNKFEEISKDLNNKNTH